MERLGGPHPLFTEQMKKLRPRMGKGLCQHRTDVLFQSSKYSSSFLSSWSCLPPKSLVHSFMYTDLKKKSVVIFIHIIVYYYTFFCVHVQFFLLYAQERNYWFINKVCEYSILQDNASSLSHLQCSREPLHPPSVVSAFVCLSIVVLICIFVVVNEVDYPFGC